MIFKGPFNPNHSVILYLPQLTWHQSHSFCSSMLWMPMSFQQSFVK